MILNLSTLPILICVLLGKCICIHTFLPTSHHLHKTRSIHDHPKHCSTNGEVCSINKAQVCNNGTCVTACSQQGMSECTCDTEEDNYCYLCCGDSSNRCLPAHDYNILKVNGERWERESCSRCRMQGGEMEGLACDDRDSQRLCLQGKCSKSVCHNKSQGSFCDRKLEKVCVDDSCDNPCAKIAPHLMVCDCPAIDQDTGFASEDRCQLCCYDFNIKPANRRCQNGYRKYGISDSKSRPIWRIGLTCAGGKTCNRWGVCSNDVSKSLYSIILTSFLILINFFT
uniref:Disintegrin domain-containing protein n=1 Tax=Rhabditophanes sp. KR3021 TaxID=114890 RepID=A0AC35UDR3_9BILA